MKRIALLVFAALVASASIVSFLGTAGAQVGDTRRLIPLAEWTGIIRDDSLLKFVPGNNKEIAAVTDEKSWKTLSQAWLREESLPEVDFKQELVFVFTFGGPNRGGASLSLDADGDVSGKLGSTVLEGPGFGYHLLRCNREGVKTLFGMPVK